MRLLTVGCLECVRRWSLKSGQSSNLLFTLQLYGSLSLGYVQLATMDGTQDTHDILSQGVIAYKTLPRQMFSALQHKTFPIYFVISMGLSSGMLGVWTWTHPDVLTHVYRPYVADVAQAYALAAVMLAQASNYFVVGPLTSK